jgi:2-dehydro-3-deoxygluconokinase
MTLVCMGEPLLEFNQQPETPDGSRLYLEGFGGDTSNAAIAAARQGAKVAYLTAIGQDIAGDRFFDLWTREGIDTAHIRRDPARPTAVYFVTHSDAGHAFLYYRRDSAAAAYTPADVPADLLAGCRMFYASGISQGISPGAADAVFHAMSLAREAGATIAYDTNYRPRLWPAARAAATIHAAIARADIALPGLEDALALTGLSDPDAIADFYLRMGPRLVVLKMGDQGALLATPATRLRIPPFPCTVVDATGAGDTFCGAFLARTLDGDTPEAAAHYAAAAAALKCQGYGAVAPIPTAAEVRTALSSDRRRRNAEDVNQPTR